MCRDICQWVAVRLLRVFWVYQLLLCPCLISVLTRNEVCKGMVNSPHGPQLFSSFRGRLIPVHIVMWARRALPPQPNAVKVGVISSPNQQRASLSERGERRHRSHCLTFRLDSATVSRPSPVVGRRLWPMLLPWRVARSLALLL